MPEAEVLVKLERLLGRGQELDPIGPVDLRRDRQDLLAEGGVVRVEQLELLAARGGGPDGLGQVGGSASAIGEMGRDDRR